MKNHKKYLIILFGIAVLIAVGIGAAGILHYYTYGQQPGIIDAELNNSGSRLYVSYYLDSLVVEIDTSSMDQIRSFDIDYPTFLKLSSNEQYLFALTSWPGKINRIRLSDGAIDEVTLEGTANSFTLSGSGDRLWVVYEVWPEPEIPYNPFDAPEHPGTGRLSEINAGTFTLTRTESIDPLPGSVIYSPYADMIYILFETQIEIPKVAGDALTGESELFLSPIGIYSPISLQKETEIIGGLQDECNIGPQMEFWDDGGRYIAVPSLSWSTPPISIRIIDTNDNTVFADLIFEGEGIFSLGGRFMHSCPSTNSFWVERGTWTLENEPENSHVLIKVDRSTLEYTTYILENINSTYMEDFAISPDGSIFYLTSPDEGRLITWSPDANNPPVCAVTATPSTYMGPAPAPIHFDASGSYDPDQGDTIGFSWDFNGDEIFGDSWDSGTESQPVKNYYQGYSGPVNVRVTDNHGASTDCYVVINIDIT